MVNYVLSGCVFNAIFIDYCLLKQKWVFSMEKVLGVKLRISFFLNFQSSALVFIATVALMSLCFTVGQCNFSIIVQRRMFYNDFFLISLLL